MWHAFLNQRINIVLSNLVTREVRWVQFDVFQMSGQQFTKVFFKSLNYLLYLDQSVDNCRILIWIDILKINWERLLDQTKLPLRGWWLNLLIQCFHVLVVYIDGSCAVIV